MNFYVEHLHIDRASRQTSWRARRSVHLQPSHRGIVHICIHLPSGMGSCRRPSVPVMEKMASRQLPLLLRAKISAYSLREVSPVWRRTICSSSSLDIVPPFLSPEIISSSPSRSSAPTSSHPGPFGVSCSVWTTDDEPCAHSLVGFLIAGARDGRG